jgi:hypothetical protein
MLCHSFYTQSLFYSATEPTVQLRHEQWIQEANGKSKPSIKIITFGHQDKFSQKNSRYMIKENQAPFFY